MTYCYNCHEYKGIFTCDLPDDDGEACGTEYCIFCEDTCPGCGGDIP